MAAHPPCHGMPLWVPSGPGPVRGSYLLVLGPPDVGGIGLRPGAGHGTQVAVQLCLHPSWAAAGLDARILSRLFLFVLLPFQVLAVGLPAESEGSLRGVCPPGTAPSPSPQFTGGLMSPPLCSRPPFKAQSTERRLRSSD